MNFCIPCTYIDFNCPSLQFPQLHNFGPPKFCFDSAKERGEEPGRNYRGLVVQKGAQGPNMLLTFLSFTIASLFVNCLN